MMLAWLKSLFATHKIVHDPELGYVALAHDGTGWWAIERDGTEGLSLESSVRWADDYYVKTIEQAGERINKHATRRGQKTVWTGS